MLRLFVDTSAWFAFANRDDPDHKGGRCAARKPRGRLITSNFIFDETVTLCQYRLGHSVAEKVGSVLLDSARVDLLRITPEDENAAWELFCNRADHTYSFTDCTSFVIMRRLGIETAAALDDDFASEGFESAARRKVTGLLGRSPLRTRYRQTRCKAIRPADSECCCEPCVSGTTG